MLVFLVVVVVIGFFFKGGDCWFFGDFFLFVLFCFGLDFFLDALVKVEIT